ncbi:MAG TPA: acyl-CoA dehydrogenase family protein [Acidimicrobiales bacterium]
MTDTLSDATDTDELLDELRSWLADNWDPDLTVAEWWGRLGTSGWAAPTLPEGSYGRGVARSVGVQVTNEIAAFGAVGAPYGLGLLLAAPTIADHGTREQIDTLVRDIVTGQAAWCQLFSEPGAGSDLAGLTAKAELDGDEWIVNGQKVWTSLGQSADCGMLIARTSPEAPKHQGISYFALDMHQPGVEVRPLREMTGHAMFNETFLTDARVPADMLIGGLNQGWAVANTTLGYERAGLGTGGGSRGTIVMPGTVAGNLEKRVGDFAPTAGDRPKKPEAGHAGARPTRRDDLLTGLARGNGTITDPLIRQDLVRLYTLNELGRLNSERLKATRAAGGDIPGMANISKLSMSAVMRLTRDLGLRIVGAQGMLHAYDSKDQATLNEVTGNPFLPGVTGSALYAQAPSIYGGTDQIQRNIIGERVLGLPKEPGNDKDLPFSQLLRNG